MGGGRHPQRGYEAVVGWVEPDRLRIAGNDQPGLVCNHHCLDAISEFEFGKDVRDMRLDCCLRHKQSFRDL